MSNPSRFDKFSLLSANGGNIFGNDCIRPEINLMQCDVRLADDTSELLLGTKVVMTLGSYAMNKCLGYQVAGNVLSEMRGSLFQYKGLPCIPSFSPQDAVDIKNYEETNEFLHDETDWNDDDEAKEGDVKRYGKTKRSNYFFWLRRDTWKCKQILFGKMPERRTPIYRSYPPSDNIINILTKTKAGHLYLDIETDYEEQNLQCFSFTFDGAQIFNVPILDWNYHKAYSSNNNILRALAIAIRDNIVVCHNGAAFDFFVLAYKYHIPIRKVYDTMIAHQRCFPDIEKSLGHCTSYWTWEMFHKDEDSIGYRTKSDMDKRLAYCGKDVFTMFLIKQEIDKYAKTIPGLECSIRDAMMCIRPYLTATLQGVRVNAEKIKSRIAINDRLMLQYNRMIETLIGRDALDACRATLKTHKPSMFAGSNKQKVHYFHRLLGYPIHSYGKQDKNTGERQPSLGKKALYSLNLKYNNPVITLICLYQQLQKETGRLNFTPYEQPTTTAS